METHKATTASQEPTLVGIRTCLEIVFPDEATRPGIRTMNDWKQKGYFPSVKIGGRVFLNPVAVRRALEKRFTVNESK